MLIRFSAVAVAALAGVLATAPVAQADESSYLNQMHQPNMVIGMNVTDNGLLRLGYAVCNGLANGQSMAQTHNTVAQTAVGMGLSPNMGTVNSVVNSAAQYLC